MAMTRHTQNLAARSLRWPLLIAATVPLLAAAAGGAEQPGASPVTPAVDMAQAASLGLTLLKVFGALILTVGLMLLLSVWLRKLGLARSGIGQGALIKILDTKMIAPKKFIAVVQVADKTLALGVTDQQITLLSRLELDCADLPLSGGKANGRQAAKSFSTLLDKALKRGGK